MSFPRWYPFTMMAVAFLGFLDATAVTIDHYTAVNLPCTLTHGCDVVTGSVYSAILGIPVSLLGDIYYLTMFLGMYLAFEFASQKAMRALSWLTIFGFGFSLWFTYVQAFLIHAFCQYCILSAVTSTTLFILAMTMLVRTRTSAPSPSPHESHAE